MSLATSAIATWDLSGCDVQVRRLFLLANDLERTYELLRRDETRLAGWRGPAADAARPRLLCTATAASRLAAAVRRVADGIRSGLSSLADAVAAAAAPQSLSQHEEVIALVTVTDARMAAAVSLGGQSVGTASFDGPRLPPSGADPDDVTGWWTALPPDQRAVAMRSYAGQLGALAGLPSAARDAANRLELARLVAALRAERELLAARALSTIPPELNRMASVRQQLAVAENVARELAALARRGRPASLLTLDLNGYGRVAIGIGDLDRARHVAVVVPGMGQDAARGVGRTVELAGRLRDEAARVSTDDTAVVAWVGYAAPGWAQVPFPTRAWAGGRSLAADLRALASARTATGRDRPHLTVVGHSYGSTVVGAAATTTALPADDLVLLGSPGVLARRAADLGRPPGRVYVGEAPLDPVADLGAFGPDPGDRCFGATRMRADPGPGVPVWERLTGGDHSHYFDPDSESLRNIARVVVGRGGEVTRSDTGRGQ